MASSKKVELAAEAAAQAAAQPKRARKSVGKMIADAISPPSPALPWKQRMAEVDARAAETRAAVEADYTERGYGPVMRTGVRWIGARTKGMPFSRHILKSMTLGQPGQPSVLSVEHPTKGYRKSLTATPALIALFYPSMPPHLQAVMLGHA